MLLNKSMVLLIATLLWNYQPSMGNTQDGRRPQTPIMGWASWNNYRININERIIKAQVDAIVDNGMKEVGYNYINIDDGFFGGRDRNGKLLTHATRFPDGMKGLVDYIHSLGLKAGIYTDAGANTCASYWDNDTIGVGVGLFGHDYADLSLMLLDWGFDFIKVDWCGGEWLGLDAQSRYTEISKLIREIRPDVVFNVCRWKFPGNWVINIADSWRISPDIANTFESVMAIVDQNADLWPFAGPGHVNDMDMLQVGRGMSYEEDKTHFSMWCMMASPLIAGNDMTSVSKETLEILTNEELIKINQDPLVYQARRVVDKGDLEIWAKPLISTMSGQVAIALLNRSSKSEDMVLDLKTIGIQPEKGYTVKDCWEHTLSNRMYDDEIQYNVKPHGVVVLRIEGVSLPFNLFQAK